MLRTYLLTAAARAALAFESQSHLQQRVKRQEALVEVTVYETVIVTAEQPEQVYSDAPVVTVVLAPEIIADGQPEQTEIADDQGVFSDLPDTNSVSVQHVSSRKRGIAYNDVTLAQTFGSKCSKCTWAYNWDSDAYGLDTKYSFVPMLWGDLDIHTSRWKQNADASIARGSKAVLSFNEPDHPDQAAMTPEQAAIAHAKWMNPYSSKVLVGAPAVTNGRGDYEGTKWLELFFTACNSIPGGCKVDFCPVHWYSEAQYGDDLLKHLEGAHNACGGKPIWLTEFAPLGNDQQKTDFLQKYLPMLDGLAYLDNYAYFMVAADNLMSGTSVLSQFGQEYAIN